MSPAVSPGGLDREAGQAGQEETMRGQQGNNPDRNPFSPVRAGQGGPFAGPHQRQGDPCMESGGETRPVHPADGKQP